MDRGAIPLVRRAARAGRESRSCRDRVCDRRRRRGLRRDPRLAGVPTFGDPAAAARRSRAPARRIRRDDHRRSGKAAPLRGSRGRAGLDHDPSGLRGGDAVRRRGRAGGHRAAGRRRVLRRSPVSRRPGHGDHAVQLSAQPRAPQGRARSRRRQPRDPEAFPAHAGDGRPARPRDRILRLAETRVLPRPRGSRRGSTALDRRADPVRELHRKRRGRLEDQGGSEP